MQTYQDQTLGGHFVLSSDFIEDRRYYAHIPEMIHLLFNLSEKEVVLDVDDVKIRLNNNEGIAYTHRQKVSFIDPTTLIGLSFNRGFYCIEKHDDEVSCTGLLFYGRTAILPFTLSNYDKTRISLLIEILQEELQTKDKIQGEMLRILLKRMIIICTRLVKAQHFKEVGDETQIETIRKFNTLVEFHYKQVKKVSEYAAMMYRSPKTITNAFSQGSEKSALTIIHERIIMESKRLLRNSDLTVKEIAAELGYQDTNHFNKLFKTYTGIPPKAFRKRE